MLMESGRIVLQAKARDPLRHPVARIGGAAARDVQPIQNGRAGSGIGKAVQAAAKPAAAGGAEGYQRLSRPVIAFQEGIDHHRRVAPPVRVTSNCICFQLLYFTLYEAAYFLCQRYECVPFGTA